MSSGHSPTNWSSLGSGSQEGDGGIDFVGDGSAGAALAGSPSKSVWANAYIELLPDCRCKCLWRLKEFKNRHATRAICHFLKLGGNHIAICRVSISYAYLARYRALRKHYMDMAGTCKRVRDDIEEFIDRCQESATNLLLESKKKVIEIDVDVSPAVLKKKSACPSFSRLSTWLLDIGYWDTRIGVPIQV